MDQKRLKSIVISVVSSGAILAFTYGTRYLLAGISMANPYAPRPLLVHLAINLIVAAAWLALFRYATVVLAGDTLAGVLLLIIGLLPLILSTFWIILFGPSIRFTTPLFGTLLNRLLVSAIPGSYLGISYAVVGVTGLFCLFTKQKAP